MSDTCKNCGGDKGIHHYLTDQCPLDGRENNEYKLTTFEPIVKAQTGANDTAMPFICDAYISGGFTKREYMAMQFMQGFISADRVHSRNDLEHFSRQAVAIADALIEELAK